MLRLLMAIIVPSGLLAYALHTDLVTVLGYAIVIAPIAFIAASVIRHNRKSRRRRPAPPARSHTPAPQPVPAPVINLTQINHHHYYPAPPHPGPPAAQHKLRRYALPAPSTEPTDHDRIYRVIDSNGNAQ